MYRVCSRVKTNGNYTNCARMESGSQLYGNKVCDTEFSTIDAAVKYITQNGDKCHIYYICEPYNYAFDKLNVGNPQCDAGENYYVRQRYAYTDKSWTRLSLGSSRPYSKTINKYKNYY